jgi:hypothetical protein
MADTAIPHSMKRFEFQVTMTWVYHVTAPSRKEAVDLINKVVKDDLGMDPGSLDKLDHPQIKKWAYDDSITFEREIKDGELDDPGRAGRWR